MKREKLYRAVRLPGDDTWCIEIKHGGFFHRKQYYEEVDIEQAIASGYVYSYQIHYKTRKEAEERINELIAKDTDEGEYGEWR